MTPLSNGEGVLMAGRWRERRPKAAASSIYSFEIT